MKSNFTQVFGDTPKNRLWEFLVDSRGLFDYSMTDISESADISWNTLKGIFPGFVKEHIVEKTRTIGRATMYKLNESHPKAVFMIGIHKAINVTFVRGGNLKVKIKVIRSDSTTPIELNIPEEALKA